MMYRPAWDNPGRGDFVLNHRFARTTKETITTPLTLAAVAMAVFANRNESTGTNSGKASLS